MGPEGKSSVSVQTTPAAGTNPETSVALRSPKFAYLLALLAAATNAICILRPDLVARHAGSLTPSLVCATSVAILLCLVLALHTRTIARDRQTDTGLEHTLDALPVGVAMWSSNGRLEYCNAALKSHFGIDSNRALSRRQLEQICARNLKDADSVGRQTRPYEIERADGGLLHVSHVPMTDGRRLGVVRDISDLHQTRRQLAKSLNDNRLLAQRHQQQAIKAEAASRAKTTFLAHLSHDIRTPLNHIIGFAEMIRREAFGVLGDRRYYAYLEDIRCAGERLRDSFEDVLELAELDSGLHELNLEPVPVEEVFQGLQARFDGMAKRAGIDLQFETLPDCWLRGDSSAVHRMLRNIVDNSLRFTPRGGRIKVSVWESDSEVVLEVSDTGIGIPPHRIKELSMPFALGDATFAREHGGMGLGIAISRAIAELSGGHLAIDSTPPLGTTVAISLMRAEPVRDTIAAA